MAVFEVIVRTDRGIMNLSRVLSEDTTPVDAIRKIRKRVGDELTGRNLEWFYITHVEEVPINGDKCACASEDSELDDQDQAE